MIARILSRLAARRLALLGSAKRSQATRNAQLAKARQIRDELGLSPDARLA